MYDKTLKRKHSNKFHYFGLGKDFLDIIPKEETTERKLNELNDIRA